MDCAGASSSMRRSCSENDLFLASAERGKMARANSFEVLDLDEGALAGIKGALERYRAQGESIMEAMKGGAGGAMEGGSTPSTVFSFPSNSESDCDVDTSTSGSFGRSRSLGEDDFLAEAGADEGQGGGLRTVHLFSDAIFTDCEETIRLNRARTTVDFVERQRMALLSRGGAGGTPTWQAVELLSLFHPSGRLLGPSDDPSDNMLEASLLLAEVCRRLFPDSDWFHLVCLLHNLGLVLKLPQCGGQADWAVHGDTFPVGCHFSSQLPFAAYLSANPDKRKRVFNSRHGVYHPGCGLDNMLMSWTASEFLFTLLSIEGARLPHEAFFVLRYFKFGSLLTGAYREFLSDNDKRMIGWLKQFRVVQSNAQARHVQTLQAGRPRSLARDPSVSQYYRALADKYLPAELPIMDR